MTLRAPRICVSSSFPEHLNRNLSIASALAEGFKEIVGAQNVHLATARTVSSAVTALQPEVVLLVGSAMPSSTNYEELAFAAMRAGSLFVFWSVEDPYEIDVSWRFTRFADVILTSDKCSPPFYDHGNVYHLATAASPSHHFRKLTPSLLRPLDVFFCGVGYRGRQRMILDAADVLARYRTVVAGDNWPPEIPFVRNERIPQDSLCDLYASSKVVLNLGRDFHMANSRFALAPNTPGPRTYEAAMAGCVQLYHLSSRAFSTDFIPGEEILTFEDISELQSKIGWVLDNPEKADAVAARGQARALRDHTYACRARTILQLLGMDLPATGASVLGMASS